MFVFENRVSVVTGAAGGIGLAMAQRFGRARMRLVLADLEGELLVARTQAMRDGGADAIALVADVTDPAAVAMMANAAYDAFGSIDLLCNNAGVVPSGRHRAVWEFSIEDWSWAIGGNVMGVVNGLRTFVPRMLAQGTPGHIVTTASVAGLVNGTMSPLYSTTKHAVVGSPRRSTHRSANRGRRSG